MRYLFFIIILSVLCGYAGAVEAEFDLTLSSLLNPLPPVSGRILAVTPDLSAGSLDMSDAQRFGNKLSMKKAMALSFLMPGAGEYYAGSKFKGQVFMGVEASLWLGYIAHRVYGGWKTDDYKSYASAHAEVSGSGRDDEFYDWVGFYDNREEFNQLGRLFFPDRAYLADTPENHWQWDSEQHRLRYKDIKEDARRIYNNSSFLIGLAVANRVISAIDTYRTVKAANRKHRVGSRMGQYKLKLTPRPFGENAGVKLTLVRKF